jgi:arsenite methyltransferase
MKNAEDSIKIFSTKFYEEAICTIYGGSLHPGGLEVTLRIGELAGLKEDSLVLDVASGKGDSALAISKNFGCKVVGVDLSKKFVKESRIKTSNDCSRENFEFIVGDAEFLPFKSSFFDVVLCECAFNLFPDKKKVLREIRQVLKPRGKLVLTDFLLERKLNKQEKNDLTFALCLANAETLEILLEWLKQENFVGLHVEDHSDKLLPFGVQLLLNSDGLDPKALKGLENLFYKDIVRYVLIVVTKPKSNLC